MHELSICSAITQIVVRTAGHRKVERVRVDIGQLRQVVPTTLAHSWEMVVFATPLEGTELEVTHIPAVIECSECGHLTELHEPAFRCGACESLDTRVVAGDELVVTSLDVVRA